MSITTIYICLLSLLMTVQSAPEYDRIINLPGWNQPFPSKMYSGLTPGGVPPGYPNGKMYFHYWFIESENNPKTDPLVLWYNGGPGASSLYGLLVELGPLLLNDLSLQDPNYKITGIPQLIRNPYSWSKYANLLIVDNPPPVGFSYCEPIGPAGNGTSCGNWNDSAVAKSNHEFLVNWFGDFPEFLPNDLYITGESYAGVYVPTIVRAILENPRGMNLKGFAVGDGCLGTEVLCGDSKGPYWQIEFMHGHGQFSNDLYDTIKLQCPVIELKHGNLTSQCQQLMSQMNQEIGGYYGYNLYDDCPHSNTLLKYLNTVKSTKVRGALTDYPCAGDAMDIWINRTDVRKALNVPSNSYFFDGDNGVGFNYTLTEKNLLPFYEHCIENTSLQILVYNGDTDPAINSFITQDIYFEYFKNKGIPKTQNWRPWTIDGKTRMGGYVTYFGKSSNFAFLTIRGSGHMVPEFKPAAASVFINGFLKGQNYPKYTPFKN